MNKQLRIAMVFSSDPSSSGGVQEHVLHLSQELRKLGHEVTIISPPGKLLPFENQQEWGKIIPMPLPNGNWANIHVVEEVDKKIEEIESSHDIFHVHEPYVPFLSWQIIKKSRLPIVTSFHTGWNKGSSIELVEKILPWLRKTFSEKVNGAIFISELVKKKWVALCGKEVLVRTISYGINHSWYKPGKRIRPKKIKLLFLARLVPRKGAHFLLEALSKNKSEMPEYQLDIVGAGPDEIRLKTLVKLYGLEDKVFFRGEIVGEEKVKFYQQADIFCVPYADEGLGLTVIEAMACGCPVLGFWNESFREMLGDCPWKKELMVKHKDTLGLHKILCRLMSDGDLRAEVSKWSIERSKKFQWNEVAKETVKLYRSVLNK